MTKLIINTWQRVKLTEIVMSITPKGNILLARRASKLLSLIEMTDDEKQSIKFSVVDGTGVKWENDAGNKMWEIEIEDKDLVIILKDALKDSNNASVVRTTVDQHAKMIEVYDQLEL